MCVKERKKMILLSVNGIRYSLLKLLGKNNDIFVFNLIRLFVYMVSGPNTIYTTPHKLYIAFNYNTIPTYS
jgi:hypothetical protein